MPFPILMYSVPSICDLLFQFGFYFYLDDASPSQFDFHFCRVDTRDRSILLADRWSDDTVFANRAYFMPEKQPAELGIDHVKDSDAGVYRCRVDFRRAQTRNSRVNLTVMGKLSLICLVWCVVGPSCD